MTLTLTQGEIADLVVEHAKRCGFKPDPSTVAFDIEEVGEKGKHGHRISVSVKVTRERSGQAS